MHEFRRMVQGFLPESLLITNEEPDGGVRAVQSDQIAPWKLRDDINAMGRTGAAEQIHALSEPGAVGYLNGGAHGARFSILTAHGSRSNRSALAGGHGGGFSKALSGLALGNSVATWTARSAALGVFIRSGHEASFGSCRAGRVTPTIQE
jgi:hypothetical protein